MANYNSQVDFKNNFTNTTSKPFIGQIINEEIPNSSQSALNNSEATILPGDPIVLTIANNSAKNLNAESGINFNNLTITKKATTATGGSNNTNVCGFMSVSAMDVAVGNNSIPVSQQGQLAKVAMLGMGATMWLEVAQTNASGFQTTLDTNLAITIDSTNGGVKVGSGTDIIAGAKVISGLQTCQKIALENGSYVMKDCLGICVRFM